MTVLRAHLGLEVRNAAPDTPAVALKLDVGRQHIHTSNLSSLCVVFLLACCAAAAPPAGDFREDWLGLFRAVV